MWLHITTNYSDYFLTGFTLTTSFLLWVRSLGSQSLLIMGWCSSIPEHRLWIPLDSVPIYFLGYYLYRPMVVWSPRLSTPSLNLPGSLFPAVRPFPLSPLPPLRPCHLVAPPQTHTKAKYHQPHRAVTHQERGAPEPPPERDVWFVCVHWRRPPENGRRGINAAGEGRRGDLWPPSDW